MQKKGIFNYMRTCFVMASLAILMFSTTSCEILCGCGTSVAKNKDHVRKHQEMLAKSQNVNDTKTGMLFSFKDENQTPHKDFSFRLVQDEEGDCPFKAQGIHTHMTAGPNVNFKSAGDDVYSNGSHKPGIGFQVGFQTVYRFSDKFSVVPGLLFKQNNASEEGEIGDGGEPPYNNNGKIEDKYTYSYLSAPILAQVNLSENLSVLAGPEINYLVGAKVKSNVSYGDQDHSEKTNLTKESVRLGVGVQAGVKYEFPDSRWSMELMYDHRLSRLNKKNPGGYGGPYETPAWRMKSVQLSAKCRICDLVKGPKHNNPRSNN